jgi:hypothetical protein
MIGVSVHMLEIVGFRCGLPEFRRILECYEA